jgi:hypothetical protein
LGKFFRDLTGILASDANLPLQQHRAGVESFIHSHDREAGNFISGEDRALDRCGPRQRGGSGRGR